MLKAKKRERERETRERENKTFHHTQTAMAKYAHNNRSEPGKWKHTMFFIYLSLIVVLI